MSCKYREDKLERCFSCGKRKKISKCKKINLIIGRFTCKSCKYYEKKV